jgi:uncharacterized protein
MGKQATTGSKPVSRTAFVNAVKTFDANTVKTMLMAAPDMVHVRGSDGLMALHIACSVKPGGPALREPNGIKTVTALLDAGAEVDAEVPMKEEGFKATPIWYAVARGGNLPLVNFLVKQGADASYSLWAAVYRDDCDMLRALLQAKPRLNLRAHGETPMFYAARLKRVKPLQLLIAAGADPSITDDHGRDTIGIARNRQLPPAVIAKLAELTQAHDGKAEPRAR